ncbi:MAG: PH domain-containing protein [Gemmatimonadetes bacterium]|jgi:hypothetical protein|nr:PH domain-containing protein [Gemmatimonadota bacterium]MBT5057245.1 PH domain-containing protein [Gemmatimonadota bacterium]MBT5142362.1 PH domain-containing protein [Gemmatimonadota bacterium]MBT5588419.1 PH domain-containing protein [Gemmatimonadota bacterium]MBT5962634.1 PH domain-containing protein [Gemmatimonadota bacterium]
MRSYRSRIDTMPLTVVLVAIFIVDIAALGVVSPVLGQQLPWLPFTWFLIAASLPVVLALTIVPVRYRLLSNQLEIRSGLSLSWRIQLADIHRVVPVVSLRPAPALSSQRLRVDYQHGKGIRSLQISPHAMDLFLQDLVSQDAGLDLQHGGIVRHGGPILLFDSLAS